MYKTGLLPKLERLKKVFLVFSLSLSICFSGLILPNVSHAGRIDEPPTPMAMVGDVLTRPVMAGVTLLGTGLFLVTLPFSLLGGNAGQTAETLMIGPLKSTFARCLGCTDVNADAFGGSQPVD